MRWVNVYTQYVTCGIRVWSKRILQERMHSFLLLSFLLLLTLLAPPPPLFPCSSPFPLLSVFLRPSHYVAQAGLGVESAGIAGISIDPGGIVPLTGGILWNTAPLLCLFPKKQPLALSNCLTRNSCVAHPFLSRETLDSRTTC